MLKLKRDRGDCMNLIAECKEKVVNQKWGVHWVLGDIEISESKQLLSLPQPMHSLNFAWQSYMIGSQSLGSPILSKNKQIPNPLV